MEGIILEFLPTLMTSINPGLELITRERFYAMIINLAKGLIRPMFFDRGQSTLCVLMPNEVITLMKFVTLVKTLDYSAVFLG